MGKGTVERAEEACGRTADLLLEAMRFVPANRIEQALRGWLPPGALDPEHPDIERLTADAMVLAADVALFQPSGGGSTAFDRLARNHKPASAEEAQAIGRMRQASFRLLRIDAVDEGRTVTARDVATGGDLRLYVADIPAGTEGVHFVTRLCPFEDGFIVVGPRTPLDDAALALAMGYVRPGGKGLSNPHRCADALYRHILRHGGPSVPGLNTPADGEAPDDLPFGPENPEIEALALAWSARPDDVEPPADEVQRARSLTDADSVLDLLASSVMAEAGGRAPELARAYARLAAVQMEAMAYRASVGLSGAVTLDRLAALIDREVADGVLPVEARALFERLRRRLGASSPGAGGPARGTDLDRLIQRIQALRAKTVEQGCTEEEAIAAAAKVAELLDRYGLSLSEIDLKQQRCEGLGISTGRRRAGPIDECVPAIAAFLDCRVWGETGPLGDLRHVFFGLPADVAAAGYLYEVVERTFATETETFRGGELYAASSGGERRSATHSFQVGLAHGIIEKLRRLRHEREAGLKTATGRDLVPLKAAAIDEDIAKLGLSFRSRARTRRRVVADAFEEGREAGRRFEYRPGIERE
ncbi:DUF7168 domain-containing protein [Azospirillum sp. ST 5-10]|uniref:DUF7168 domain-containing protein n=1 Tax=unclassified Azospirillum TaxID=2630922 RepID=UPI003F4A676D